MHLRIVRAEMKETFGSLEIMVEFLTAANEVRETGNVNQISCGNNKFDLI